MHVFGHSFSQKRSGTKRPRDLHIRKVSFSGSSVSGSSLDSSSTVSARTTIPPPQYRSSATSPSHAPPRLYERPFICIDDRRHTTQHSTFYDSDVIDDVDDDDFFDDDDDETPGSRVSQYVEENQFHMELPPHTCSLEEDDDTASDHDYFFMQVAKRPPMPRSRWSESTIQSLDQYDVSRPTSIAAGSITSTAPSSELDFHEAEGPPVLIELPPNFTNSQSQSRAHSVPGATKRPPMVRMDTVEEFIKNGGWKRRGIVFHGEEIYTDGDGFSLI